MENSMTDLSAAVLYARGFCDGNAEAQERINRASVDLDSGYFAAAIRELMQAGYATGRDDHHIEKATR